MKLYTHAEVLTVFPGLKGRTLQSWCDKKLIRPKRDTSGSGYYRLYSYENLVQIGIVRNLFMVGLSLATIRHTKGFLGGKFDGGFFSINSLGVVLTIQISRGSIMEQINKGLERL